MPTNREVEIYDHTIMIPSEKKLQSFLKKQMKELFTEHYDYWYQQFEEPIHKPKLKFRKMKTRWGVCNRRDDSITLNTRLLEYDTKYLDYVIIHATEGHLIADELLEDNARTIVGPVISERCKPELRNHTIETAGVLNKAGVPMCICTDHPVVPEQYLPLSAGLAVRGGLDRNEALKAITIYPAQITGIADRVGSIEVGKDADIVIFSGDPLSVCDTPDMVIVNGTVI
mgnify:CR=1 FL=1